MSESEQEAMEQLSRDAAVGRLVRSKLVSGNAIPIDRCLITAREVAALDAEESKA